MDQSPKPERPRDAREDEADGERHSTALQKFIGFVMMVLAWLQLLVAVSSGSDANSIPFLLFFAGIVIFVNGTVAAWYKYAIMGTATIVGLAFHYHISSLGAATRWEKYVVVYGTIVIVGYFMFVGTRPARRIRTPDPPPSP
jgi:hypothetical protein